MKKLLVVVGIVILATMMFTGCAGMATMNHSPVTGFIYTDVKAPLPTASAALTGTGFSKMGEATATSILGWVGMGDASVEAAMKAGGISKVHHIDYHATQILGLYATYTVIVYGE